MDELTLRREASARPGSRDETGVGTAVLDCQSRLHLLAELTEQLVRDHELTSGSIIWSGAIARVTGYTPRELQVADARAWEEMIHPEDRAHVLRALEASEHDGRSFEVEYRLRRKDGSYVYVEDRGAFLRDASGKTEHILAVIVDVTRRRETQQQLVQAQKMEAIGRLAGGIAHDFNNIVSVIVGYSEQALRRLDSGSTAIRPVTQTLEAANHAAALTRQLMTFARKEALRPVVVDPNQAVRDVEGMLRRLIGEDIALNIELDSALERVVFDLGRFEHVLLNLATNARDAMPSGGTLTLKTMNVDAGDRETRSRVLLQVRDTGHGMEEEVRERVFEPFYTTKAKGSGTGLGLATVHDIVRRNGGAITVESAVGLGTTFSVSLPSAAEGQVAAVASTTARGTGGNETILLVEDEIGLLQVMKEGLEREGYTVLAAPGSQTALDLARRRKGAIDLLLTDVIMPGMSGCELASCLVAERHGLRTLYMSGYTADVMERKGLPIEGMELLSKPFTQSRLHERIRHVLDGPRWDVD